MIFDDYLAQELGWGVILAVLVMLAIGAWYGVLRLALIALKETYYMGLFFRFWAIAAYRKRRIALKKERDERFKLCQKADA